MKRALSWLLIAWLIGEWYTRGGREFLMGDREERDEQLREFEWVVQMPRDWSPSAHWVGKTIKNKKDEPVGYVEEVLPGGSEIPPGVVVKFDRQMLGWPIHSALAEAEHLTRAALA